MKPVHHNPPEQPAGPFNRRISRRDAIKIGGLATLGLAFHRPVIETIRPTQIFANNCYGCGPSVTYNPSPFTIQLFQTRILTTSITFCIDQSVFDNGGIKVELLSQEVSGVRVLDEQFVVVSQNQVPGTCVKNLAIAWSLQCLFGKKIKGRLLTSVIADPRLTLRLAGQSIGEVQAICTD